MDEVIRKCFPKALKMTRHKPGISAGNGFGNNNQKALAI
jgi:hypothetical protein